MKTRLEQLEIELAFENGAKIEMSSLAKINEYHFYNGHSFRWDLYDYRIKVEPQRIPFDSSDYVNILNKKISHKLHKFTGILTMVDGSSIVIGDKRFDINLVSEHLQWYNELLNEWKSCSKIK